MSRHTVTVESHPLLDPGVSVTELPAPLGEMMTPSWLEELFRLEATAPLARSEETRAAVRNLLRHGGYKPTGRGKPASEYLVRAAGGGTLGSINLAVDTLNAVSLHSGLPISVVDLDLTRPPLGIAIAEADASYVFNPSGQEIRVGGLLCLQDAEGPCANAVKDSQRTKTHPETRRTLSVVWGTKALGDWCARAVQWYRELLEQAGATTLTAEISSDPGH